MIGDGQLSRLADLVAEIESKPNFGLVVYGFVDRNECVLSACRELSFRRAKVVYDWLVRSGLSPRQLKGPIGESFGFSNEKDDVARFNRRVGFDLYVLDDASP